VCLQIWDLAGATGMETGFSLLKSAVNDLSNSSFSAFRAKQKSEILFWAVIKIYKIINNN